MNIEHIEVLKALADGEAIEWQLDCDSVYWLEPTQYTNPISAPHLKWRVKPKQPDYNPFNEDNAEQVLMAIQSYRKAHIESFKDFPPNWTDPYQSKWALVIDGSELTAKEVFTGVQYPYIFANRVDALRFVDAIGYEEAMNMLRGW